MLEEDVVEDWKTLLRARLPAQNALYGVRRLWLFGSYARGEAMPGVPVDLLAELDRALSYDEFLALQSLLGECLGQTVELVLKGTLTPTINEIIQPELIPLFAEEN
jgi:predicted nucleotidyltransferase